MWQSQMGWIQSDLAVALSIKPFAELHWFQSMEQGALQLPEGQALCLHVVLTKESWEMMEKATTFTARVHFLP